MTTDMKSQIRRWINYIPENIDLIVKVAQIIGTIGVLVTIAWGIYIYIQQQQIKALQVVILANDLVVDVDTEFAEKVQISYEEQSIDNLSLVQIMIVNTGNQAIRSIDYEQPIRIILKEGIFVEAEIVTTQPNHLGISIQKTETHVTLSEVLLNTGNRVIIKFLIANLHPNEKGLPFEIKYRIADVLETDPVEYSDSMNPFQSALFTLIVMLGIGLLTFLSWRAIRNLTRNSTTPPEHDKSHDPQSTQKAS